MEERYMLFLTKEQVKFLEGALDQALDYALRTSNREMMIIVTALLSQVRNPRKLKPRSTGWAGAIKAQILG